MKLNLLKEPKELGLEDIFTPDVIVNSIVGYITSFIVYFKVIAVSSSPISFSDIVMILVFVPLVCFFASKLYDCF